MREGGLILERFYKERSVTKNSHEARYKRYVGCVKAITSTDLW